jgi:hypothetical protein
MSEMPHDEADREVYGESQPVDDENQLQPEDTLDDRDLADVLDRGYSPPDRPPAGYDDRPTGAEQHEGESLDERLAQEQPEPDPYAEARACEDDEDLDADALDENALPDEEHDHDPGSVAEARAGRLVAPDEGFGDDESKQEIATDVGVDGAGASAEEAAMHIEDESAGDRRLEDEREGQPRG